jgi:hypothetical protein
MSTSFIAPKTWAVGDVWGTIDINTYVRDNTSWLGTDRPLCRVRRTTDQAAAVNTPTPISYDTIVFDTQHMWNSLNPTRFIVPTGLDGNYLLIGQVKTSSGAGTVRYAYWEKNDAIPGVQRVAVQSLNQNNQDQQASTMVRLSSDDYVQFLVFSDVAVNAQGDTAVTPNVACLAWMST